MAEKPESTGLLAIIDAKIAALQQLRESVLGAMSVGAFGQSGDIDPSSLPVAATGGSAATPAFGQQNSNGPIELPTGVFRGKGLSDAIRLYLSIAKRKRTPSEIQAALMEGGLATTSEFFEQTLSATLHRMRKSGELLQFKDGWDLASSYPDGFRQRMAQSSDTPKRKKRAKKADATAKSKAQAKNGKAKSADPQPA